MSGRKPGSPNSVEPASALRLRAAGERRGTWRRVDPDRHRCARVLRGRCDPGRGPRPQDRPVRPDAGPAQDPDHARADHPERCRGPAGPRGRAVREPVQGVEVDVALRLDLSRRPSPRARRAPALLHRAGVGAGGLRPGGRSVRRARHGRGACGPVGTQIPRRPGSLHLCSVRPLDARASRRHWRERRRDAVRRPHRHRRLSRHLRWASCVSTGSRFRPTACCCCTSGSSPR